MKDTFNDKTYSEGVEMAHLRFAVIAPAIQGLFSEPSKAAYYRRVAEKPLVLPNGTEMFFNAATFAKWEQYYKKNGIDGLMPRARSDVGSSRVLSDTAIAEIYRLKKEFPRINATLIHSKLIADGFIKASEASVSAVQRFIKKNAIKCGRQLSVKDRKAFEEEFPGDMYQADTCHTIYITEDGKRRKTYLVCVLDDHSRMIVGARFFYNDTAYNFQLVLKEAIARHGLCKKLYVDYTEEKTMPKKAGDAPYICTSS